LTPFAFDLLIASQFLSPLSSRCLLFDRSPRAPNFGSYCESISRCGMIRSSRAEEAAGRAATALRESTSIRSLTSLPLPPFASSDDITGFNPQISIVSLCVSYFLSSSPLSDSNASRADFDLSPFADGSHPRQHPCLVRARLEGNGRTLSKPIRIRRTRRTRSLFSCRSLLSLSTVRL